MTAATEHTTPSDVDRRETAQWLDRAPQAALATFIAIEAVAAALFLWFGRHQWFYWDEWELLAGRSVTSSHDLLTPWHSHWVGGATVVYHALFHVFGLNTYLPYQLLAVGTHMALAALLRVIMRRAGVGPWVATVVAASFVLFGSGKQNIVWGFQITFGAAVLFGLIHLLLADHEGGLDWRDVLGVLAGLVALTFSGAGAVMIAVVGLAVFVRRGLVMAAVHVVPVAAVFVMWWLAYGRKDDYVVARSRPGQVVRYTSGGFEATLHALGQLPATSYVLGAVLVVGLAVAWRHLPDREVRRRAIEPAALLLGGLVFLALTGWTRAWVIEALAGKLSYLGRYLHVTAAMLLPAMAVAIDALARRWRVLGPLLLLPLLIGWPGNIREIADRDPIEKQQEGDPALFLAVANSPRLSELPGSLQPFPENEQGIITVQWLREAHASGRIPASGAVRGDILRGAELRLSIEQTVVPVVVQNCATATGPMPRHLDIGQSIGFRGGFNGATIRIMSKAPGASRLSLVTYNSNDGQTLTAVAGPLDVELQPQGTVTVCG